MAVLQVPLNDNIFPKITFSDSEVAAYEKLNRDKIKQLVRIAEDADCVYKWAEITSKSGNSCYKARIVDRSQGIFDNSSIFYVEMLIKMFMSQLHLEDPIKPHQNHRYF